MIISICTQLHKFIEKSNPDTCPFAYTEYPMSVRGLEKYKALQTGYSGVQLG